MDPRREELQHDFTKAASCIVPADSELIKPRAVRFLDYEIELGLVLKREINGKQIVADAEPA
nr:fumarylacetoacetate hydrolase family protein [Pseudomonas aeruginosa]